MEVWRADVIEGRRPKVVSAGNLVVALVLHVAAFAGFWAFAWLHGFLEPKETVVPIDLTVIVNENLDGKENEPPPLKNPEPPKPKPKPKPKPQPKPKPKPAPAVQPKPLERIVTNVVAKAEAKKPEAQKKPEEPPQTKKDEAPKKSAKELREERMRRMRESAVKNTKPVAIEVKNAKASGDGKTARQTMSRAEIERLLGMGYKPGTENQLAASEMQLGVSLVQMALNEKWDQLAPKVGRDGTVLLSCRFNSAGGLTGAKIVRSCGDPLSDGAALSVAQRVTSIRGLPEGFRAKFSKETLTIRYDVRGR